jgi:DNA-binding transcriptional ArsR family regulator
MNRVFKALADPTRRRVLQLLRGGPMSAGELSEQFDVSKPTMSAHFSVLQAADLIEAQKHGRVILYRLKLSVLEETLLSFAQTVGSRSPAAGRTRRRARVGGPFRSFLRGTS